MTTIKDKTLQEIKKNFVHIKEVDEEPEDRADTVTDVEIYNHVQYFQVAEKTETVLHSIENEDG